MKIYNWWFRKIWR